MSLNWVASTNIYEVNLRQYTTAGTFSAFSKHVTRLKNMGVETLWFMPLTPISYLRRKGTLGSYYACSDYKAINPEFGTEEDFAALVGVAHANGMKVIIDWVANHTGWDHSWTKQHPEFYKRDHQTGSFLAASGMDDIIELDFEKEETEDAMIEAMLWWVKKFNIDGFRCDLAFWVKLDFWKKARAILDKTKPLFWLGEFDEMERPEYGETFDASYSWKWMHKTEDYYKEGKQLKELIQLLKAYDDLGPQCLRTWFTSNHDENSWNGTEYEKYGAMARPLAVFSITWDGIPLIYSGQELPNKKRLLFFEKDPIEWQEDLELENFYRELLLLKKNHPALRAGDMAVRTILVKTTAPSQVLAYLRSNGEAEILILLNLSSTVAVFDIIDERVKGELFSNKSYELNAFDYVVVS